MFFCEEKYKCLQQTLLTYYAWSTDTESSPCDNCGNCQHKSIDNPNLNNVTTDAIRMINIVRNIIEELEEDNIIVRDDIIGVFLQLKNKKLIDKKLNSVSIYDENFDRTIRNSRQANHLLDELICKKIITEVVTLQKSGAGFWIANSQIINVAESAEELIYSCSWDYYL
jgi:superfamily II DNA helicase RecQ